MIINYKGKRFLFVTDPLNLKPQLSSYFCIAALLCYIPMIWQRFNFTFGIDSGGLYFDIAIVAFMVIFITISLTSDRDDNLNKK